MQQLLPAPPLPATTIFILCRLPLLLLPLLLLSLLCLLLLCLRCWHLGGKWSEYGGGAVGVSGDGLYREEVEKMIAAVAMAARFLVSAEVI